MLKVSFICYDKDRAIKPKAITESMCVYEVYCAEVTQFEDDEKRIIVDSKTGIRVPPGYVAEVIPNPSIFWFTDLTTQGGTYFIPPGQHDSIKLFLLAVHFQEVEISKGVWTDTINGIPGPGTPIAIIKLTRSTPFEAEWDGNEPDQMIRSFTNLN